MRVTSSWWRGFIPAPGAHAMYAFVIVLESWIVDDIFFVVVLLFVFVFYVGQSTWS
jgi:hypothetical protein